MKSTKMLREGLHGIEHAVMTGILLKHIHWHTASGVDEQSFRLIWTDMSCYIANGVVFDGKDVNRSIFVDFIGMTRVVAA